MTPTAFETALRAVPLLSCGSCYACLHGTGRCADLRPDYPALAQTAWETGGTAQPSLAEVEATHRKELGGSHDSETCQICWLMREANRALKERDSLRTEITSLNRMRVQLSTDSQNHLDRALRGEAEVARLRERCEERARDLEALRDMSERPKCLYCAFGETGPAATMDALQHHIEHDCHRHPIGHLTAEVQRLRGALAFVRGNYQPACPFCVEHRDTARAALAPPKEP